MRKPGGAAGTATVGGSVEAAPAMVWIAALAWSVVSAPHPGQNTGAGIRLLMGSTSNLNFVPQVQRTLISIHSNSFLQGCAIIEGDHHTVAMVRWRQEEDKPNAPG
jgi:hypothetical protein